MKLASMLVSSALSASFALSSACTPTLSLVTYQPGIVSPRGRTQVNIVRGEGIASARDEVARDAYELLRNGWWRPVDRSDDNVRITLVGHRAEFVPKREAAAVADNDALWLRLDVVNWRVEETTMEDKKDDGTIVTVPARHVVVGLQVTVVDEDGHILVDERAYEEDDTSPSSPLVSPELTLSEALRTTVAAFVADLTPDRVVGSVRLDDSDPGQKVMVQAAAEGKAAVVARMLKKYLRKNPTNSIAHYNLGCVLEAQGQYDEALRELDKALDIQPRDYYPATRLACQERRSAWLALYGDEKLHKAKLKDAAKDAAHEKNAGDTPEPDK